MLFLNVVHQQEHLTNTVIMYQLSIKTVVLSLCTWSLFQNRVVITKFYILVFNLSARERERERERESERERERERESAAQNEGSNDTIELLWETCRKWQSPWRRCRNVRHTSRKETYTAYTVIGYQVQRNLCEIKVEPQLIEILIAVLSCCLHFNIHVFSISLISIF
jgi:hypothetical protein